jgi:Ion channel
MSLNPEESTILNIRSRKVFDLKSQLSFRKRKEDSIQVEKSQFCNDFLLTILSIISVFVVYIQVTHIQSEEFYREEIPIVNNQQIVLKKRNSSNQTVTNLRVLNIVMTLFICKRYAVILIYRHYNLELKKNIIRKNLSKYGNFYIDGLKSSGLVNYMILEMIVMGIFCPPYFDYEFSGSMLHGTYTYSIEIIISIITMVRILQVIRIYGHFSIWMSPEAYIIGKRLNIVPSLFFSLKADLKFQPQVVLLPIIGLLVLIMGYAVRNLERPYNSDTKSSLDFDYLTNGYWLAIVTMCTVGYGDGYPSTHLGRLIMILTAGISLVAISLYIFALNLATMLSKEQSKAYYIIKEQKKRMVAKNNSSNVIKDLFYLKKALLHKTRPNYLKELFIATALLRDTLHNFAANSPSHNKYLPPAEMIMQLEHKLTSDINFIKKEIIDIDYIGERLQELINSEEKISKNISDIMADQDKIDDLITDLNLESLIRSIKLTNS